MSRRVTEDGCHAQSLSNTAMKELRQCCDCAGTFANHLLQLSRTLKKSSQSLEESSLTPVGEVVVVEAFPEPDSNATKPVVFLWYVGRATALGIDPSCPKLSIGRSGSYCRFHRGSGSGCHRAIPVLVASIAVLQGSNGRVSAVPHMDFPQDLLHVDLDCRFCDVAVAGNHFVGVPFDQSLEIL